MNQIVRRRIIALTSLAVVFVISASFKERVTGKIKQQIDRIVPYYSNKRAIVEFKGKQGVIDLEKKSITPFMYDEIDRSVIESDRDYIFATIDGKAGITDLAGKTIVPFDFKAIYAFNRQQNYVIGSKAKPKGLPDFGVADLSGKTIVPFEYRSILSHTPDITLVNHRGEIGILDRQAEFTPLVKIKGYKNYPLNIDEFIPSNPNHDDYFINDLALVSYQDGDIERYCVVNRQGKLLVSSKAATLQQRKMDDSLCAIVAGKTDYDLSLAVKTLIDSNDSFPHTKKHYGFNSNLFQISINGKYAYVNLEGELVTWTQQFDQIGNFSQGLAPFVKDNRYGFVTPQGEIAFYLDEDLVATADYISRHNSSDPENIDFVFYPEKFTQFENGLAKIIHINVDSLETEWDCPAYDKSPFGYAYIDKTGKIVKYESIVSIESTARRGSDGNFQWVDCDLR